MAIATVRAASEQASKGCLCVLQLRTDSPAEGWFSVRLGEEFPDVRNQDLSIRRLLKYYGREAESFSPTFNRWGVKGTHECPPARATSTLVLKC